jgi:DNA-binding beta-propeller fold protein YncE
VRFAALVAAVALVACSSASKGSAPSTTTAPAHSRTEISPLEGRPSAVAVGAGAVWVADDARGVVLRLDERNGRQVGPPVAVSPHPIAIDVSDSKVWVADRAGTITRIDIASATVTDAPIDLGGHVVDLIVDGKVVWVADIETNTVQPLDVGTGALGERVVVVDGVVRLAAGPTGVWVTNRDHTATQIDRATHKVGPPVAVGAFPIGVTIANGVAWIANSDDGTVSRLGADDGHTIGPAVDVGGAPISIAVANDDAWVVQQDARAISRLDARTGVIVERGVDLHLRPRDAASSSAGTWVVGIDPSAAVLVRPPGA